MRFVELIEKKKAGKSFTKAEIDFWIEGYCKGDIPDYQVSALCMAICFQGMDRQETAWLCEAMLNSGSRMDLSDISGCICDKHSTGGVGDKTSLALAPMVAACGAKVAKMSGRGLGHTGGTLDKLESISDFKIVQKEADFIKQVNEINLAIIGQSKMLVPADRLLYGLRDVTATVDSIPLIASSIMSKKLASGADTILLDVKYGKGAFMLTLEKAQELAKTMISIGAHFHKDTRAVITSMNQPLGRAIGNVLELKEAIDTLQGKGPKDFTQLCMEMGSIMLMQANIAQDKKTASEMLHEAISSGKAFEKLKEMCAYQGGDVKQLENPNLLPKAKHIVPMPSLHEGYIKGLHAQQLGIAAMRLGAGRATKQDQINHAVGIVLQHKTGDYVKQGDCLAFIHTDSELSEEWKHDFYEAISYSKESVEPDTLIAKTIDSNEY